MYSCIQGKSLRIVTMSNLNWDLFQALGTNSKKALKNSLDYGIGQRKGYPYSPRKNLVNRLGLRFSLTESQVKRELMRFRIHFLKEMGYSEEEIENYGISLQSTGS